MEVGSIRMIRPRSPKRRPFYRYEITGKDAAAFLRSILQELIEKRYQAELLLALRSYPKGSMTHGRILEELDQSKRISH
jgi:hypothetical protein